MQATTPRYEYSKRALLEKAAEITSLKTPFGYQPRYAIKANPHSEVISLLHKAGIQFDASSSYEVDYLLKQGIPASNIALSSQQSAHNLEELLAAGVRVAACSLHQLKQILSSVNKPQSVTVRINPDYGSGHNNRTSTGGTNASFGIWHEYISEVQNLCATANVAVEGIHIHVGSGADPEKWGEVLDRCLEIAELIPEATTLNIGGGFKVRRMHPEQEADLTSIFTVFSRKLLAFKEKFAREINLEIEPGTYLVAHMGTLVANVDDIVDTGKDGYTFLKLNTGMNDFLRTTMYGSQHRIEVISDNTEEADYVVVGHNCESGDIFTTKPYDPEILETRLLKKASIGDEVRIYDAGAYCASMRAKGYNSFPDAIEVFVD